MPDAAASEFRRKLEEYLCAELESALLAAREEERERCAVVCEKIQKHLDAEAGRMLSDPAMNKDSRTALLDMANGADKCAAQIRARK